MGCRVVTLQRQAAASKSRPFPCTSPPPSPEVELGVPVRGSSRLSRPPHTFKLYLNGAKGTRGAHPAHAHAPASARSAVLASAPEAECLGARAGGNVPNRAPAGPGPIGARRFPCPAPGVSGLSGLIWEVGDREEDGLRGRDRLSVLA